MRATPECLECLRAQAKRTLSYHKASQNALDLSMLDSLPLCPPPQIAVPVYAHISSLVRKQDLYEEQKIKSIQKARQALEQIQASITIPRSLEFGIKLAALGNVIDYGNASDFDVESCLFDMDSMEFAIYDIEQLESSMARAQRLVYIGDNAGEDVFDSAFIKILLALYPRLSVYYFTRGAPIINDITLQDLLDSHSPILQVCEVVDSGVGSPGFLYEYASSQARDLYDSADVVLAKGMGNFECLESSADSRVFLLFKIKCAVVARFLQQPQGSFVLKNLCAS